MGSEHQPQGDDAIDIDQIGRFRSFDELKQNESFRKFLRILHEQRPELFGETNEPSEDELVDYFVSHPSIWNETEEFWKNDVRKEGKSLESFQAASNITSHIRRLIARALQRGKLQLAEGEDRDMIFDFQSRKNRPNREWQPEFRTLMML